MAAVASQITQYQANNNGKLPKSTSGSNSVDAYDETSVTNGLENWNCATDAASRNSAKCFIRNYMNASGAAENTFKDPDGWMYGLTIVDQSAFTMPTDNFGTGNNKYMIYLVEHAKCGDDESVEKSDNARDYAIVYKLEGSGTYCNDNS